MLRPRLRSARHAATQHDQHMRQEGYAHVNFPLVVKNIILRMMQLGSDVRVSLACSMFEDAPPDAYVVCVLTDDVDASVQLLAHHMPIRMRRFLEPTFVHVDEDDGSPMIVFPKLYGMKETLH